MSTSDQTINLPQLVLVLIIGGLAYRYFFYTPSSSTPETRNANNARAREADVERIMQMFPQADRRSIMWDLQRNGGNLPATTERILSGRGLEVVSVCSFLPSRFG
jgi:coupling of ubiquitin conjugation to ER degradation protein 1